MKREQRKAVWKKLRESGVRIVGDFRFQAVLGCMLCTLVLLAVMDGNRRQADEAGRRQFYLLQKQIAERVAVPRREEAEARIRAEVEESVAESVSESIAEENRIPELTAAQKEILDQISDCLEFERLEEAARLMLENQGQMEYLYCRVMREEPWLYDGGKLYRELSRTGLVLRKPMEVFWGDFSDGEPEGRCSALQVEELDYPRYDYACGVWENGKMNGEGIVGYCYLEDSGEENRSVSRQGKFVHDLMDGPVRYETINGGGEIFSWNMLADNGKPVLDEAWIFDEEKKVYCLLSEQDKSHAFVISEEETGETRFQNLLKWD